MKKVNNVAVGNVLIPNFKTIKQSSDHTSGPACVKMVSDFFVVKEDAELNERQISREVGALPIFGASVRNMEKYFLTNNFIFECSLDRMKAGKKSKQKFKSVENLKSFALENLSKGFPIIVEKVDKSGRWMIIVGYEAEGDIFIVADPAYCETEESFVSVGAEGFFETWSNPKRKEEHLMQPYFVIKGKKSLDI